MQIQSNAAFARAGEALTPPQPRTPQPEPMSGDEACADLIYERLREHGDTFGSFGLSLREAAFRGSDIGINVHLKQLRLVTIDAIGLGKELFQLKGKQFS
jgi:hypothetical protein